MIIEIVLIGGLGLVFGSFVNALLWRVHKQATSKKGSVSIQKRTVDLSITKGRSVCVKCGHELGVTDLIPVLSWVSLRGKCRYCKKPIDDSPLVEVGLSLLFMLSYIAWPYELESLGEWLYFGLWQALVVGLWALFIYDIRWMLLPNRILYPLFGLATGLRFVELVVFDVGVVYMLRDVALGLLIGGGIFYLIFQLSQGRWIGGGDVKLGFLIGVILGPLYGGVALISAFYLAALYILPLMLIKKVTRKSRIPFGPFLIAGLFGVMLWGEAIVDLYKNLTGLA